MVVRSMMKLCLILRLPAQEALPVGYLSSSKVMLRFFAKHIMYQTIEIDAS
jgi:hypothetical protein